MQRSAGIKNAESGKVPKDKASENLCNPNPLSNLHYNSVDKTKVSCIIPTDAATFQELNPLTLRIKDDFYCRFLLQLLK